MKSRSREGRTGKKAAPPRASGRDLPAGRKRAFLVFTLAFPFLFLLLIEMTLRVVGYGPDLSLFITEQSAGRTYHIMNPDVKARYFSRVEFSPNTSMDFFLVPKPPDVYRIFCLGGSTTVGYPYGYAGSFSTFLRDRLRVLFPERQVDIINLGMTATNSYTTLDIGRELAAYEPDLIIVYDGHNEFYGAHGIASHESPGEARWLTTLYLRMVHVRTFLLLRDLVRGISGIFSSSEEGEAGGTMMERLARGQYIAYGSEPYRLALRNFAENMDELIRATGDVPLILSSQVSNLRHLAPFVSEDPEKSPAGEGRAYDEAVSRGVTHWRSGSFDSAAMAFRTAVDEDSLRADGHYELARCLVKLGSTAEARRAYIRARDLDLLRFRTTSDFNDAIRNRQDGRRVLFADMEQVFASSSPDSIVGQELILEHLHPNARGYFLMAKEYARLMRAHALFASAEEWAHQDTATDEALWEQRSLAELDERAASRRTEILTSGWPFSPVPKAIAPIRPDDEMGRIVEQLVLGRTTWEQAHVAAAQYFESQGEYDKAEAEYRTLLRQFPLNTTAYLVLAQLHIRQEEYDEAVPLLRQSLTIERTAFAYRSLGSIELQTGLPDSAAAHLEQALGLSTASAERVETGYLLAVAYARTGWTDGAITQVQQVLRLNPRYAPARDLLNRLEQRQP